ncbi:VOC family protein [Bryobacter aggregatus]|uniref:VOC family protein n=1 Tax=Bryobacter aggregatus TaxID=360054 RepID=UPI0004E27F32|nr:VOC family protein [Bryobacter aggregatus]
MKVLEVFPYLRAHDANAALDFYKRAFGAVEGMRLTEPNGRIGHAEFQIGPTTLMLSDEYPEYQILGPLKLGGVGMAVHLHTDDVDALTQQALDAGATLLMPLQNQFYGERSSKVRDPFGHEWLLGQHIEDVTPEEMQRRFNEMTKS